LFFCGINRYMRRGKSSSSSSGGGAGDSGRQGGGGEEPPAAGAGVATSSDGTANAAAAAADRGASGTAAAGGTQSQTAANPYETSIKTIATVSTVEEFWAAYDFLRRPNELPTTTDYHFFRSGIKPTWEDPCNARGGKWIVRLPKGLASRYWEEIILALVGGQFTGVPDGEICGAVLSVRYSEDILGVWNRTSSSRNNDMIDRIRDGIKRILQLPPHANMEYKPHQNSIADRSSFRNTTVWKPKSSSSSSTRGAGGGTVDGEGGGGDRGEARRSNSWGERGDGGGGGPGSRPPPQGGRGRDPPGTGGRSSWRQA